MSSSSSNMSADTVLFGNGGKCNLTSNWRTNGSLDIPFGKMHLNCLGSVVQPDTSYLVGVGTDNELKLVANGGGGGGTTGGISTANITSAGIDWTVGQTGPVNSVGGGTGATFTVTAILGTGATSVLVSVNYTTAGTGYSVNDLIELINTTIVGSNAFATVTAITGGGGGTGGDVFLNGKDVSATNSYNDNIKNEFKGEIHFTSGSITNEPSTVGVMTASDRVLSVDTNGKLVTNTKIPDSSIDFSNGGYLSLDGPTKEEVKTNVFFSNINGLEVRNKIELTADTTEDARIEIDHNSPAINVDIPINHLTFIKSAETGSVAQMAMACELAMIRDGDVLIDNPTHTPVETRGKPPNKRLGYNTTSGEITYIDDVSPATSGAINLFTIQNRGTLFTTGVTQYPVNGGSGSGGVFEVTGVGAGGVVTTVFKVTGGIDYIVGDSVYLISGGGGNDCILSVDGIIAPTTTYADLTAGTSLAPQEFTGHNKFNSTLITAGIQATSVFGSSVISTGAITSTTNINCGGDLVSTPDISSSASGAYVALWEQNTGSTSMTLKRESALSFMIVVQGFVGSAASVTVNGVARSAYSTTPGVSTKLHSTSKFGYYPASPIQYMILHFGGVYKVCFRGQLEITSTGAVGANIWSFTWEDMLYLFGDYVATGTQPTGLINQPSGGAISQRYFGPDDEHFSPVTRRLVNTGNYNGINCEASNLSYGTGASNLGFMRFTEALNYSGTGTNGDRVILDSVFYWADGPP